MKSPEIPTELSKLVERVRNQDESIWHWNVEPTGSYRVMLIDSEASEQAKRFELIGLPGGSGRVLHFTDDNGTWKLSHESKWIA